MKEPIDAAELEREKEAILSAQRGEEKGFEYLYLKYHRGLYGYLLSMLRSPQGAEDLSQDIFVKLYRQIGSYRFQSPFSHWLFRSARNLAIDQFRRDKVRFAKSLDEENEDAHPLHERLPGPEATPQAHLLKKERDEVIRQAVSELPEVFKVVMVMREWEDLPYEEIGQRLGLSVGTIKSRLFRARDMLAKKLKGWDQNLG
jgi:RNA polymerase sigma-70 factor (ECF subfamily)